MHDFYDGCTEKKKGILAVGAEGSRLLYDLYSMEGMLTFSKFVIAHMKWMEVAYSTQGVFTKCLSTMEPLKELYYATFCFISLPEFIEKKPNGRYVFTLPKFVNQKEEKEIDVVKILFTSGGLFDTGGFLKKQNAFQFGFCASIADQIGSWKLFSLVGNHRQIDEIPVLNFLCFQPKNFFFFCASIGECLRWVKPIVFPYGNTAEERAISRSKQFELLPLLKLAGSVGRALGIFGYRYYGGKKWFVTVQLITQYANFTRFLINRQQKREERFYYPVAPAA